MIMSLQSVDSNKTVLAEGPDHTPKGSWKFSLIYGNFVDSNSSPYPP